MTPRLSIFFFAIALIMPQTAQAQRVDQLQAVDVAPRPTPAQTREAPVEERIAAVVNDSIVSTSDVRSRLMLTMLSSGLPESDEVKQRMFPQVLRSLIDEQLQLQEGKRLGIAITDEELDNAMKKLAQDNKIPGGDMKAFLKAHGVPPTSLVNQIKAVLTWNKVVQRELRPHVDVGDDEIDAVVDRLKANAGRQEYLVSEIYLAVDNPKDEENVKSFADNLVAQIKKGANFGALARQFSQGTGASTGGDIGWIQAGQLAKDLDNILLPLEAGEIAGPVRSTGGYHILGVRDKRTIALGDPKKASMKLHQVSHPLTEDKPKEKLLKEADKMRQTINSCRDLPARVREDFPGWKEQDLGDVKMAEAPEWLVDKVRDIAVGRGSEAMATDKAAIIVFVCERDIQETVNRNEIMNAIGTERMELLARRHMRDLRRKAHIDVRLALTK